MSIISAGNTTTTSFVVTGDTTGNLVFQTQAGTNTITVPNVTGTLAVSAPPNVTVYTSGSGTYTVPTNCKWLQIEMVGAGGGGAGSGGGTGAGNGGLGGNGGTTTFGSSLLTCTGGFGAGNSSNSPGSGGTATLNSPAVGLASNGVSGSTNGQYNTALQVFTGGVGGSSSPLGAYGSGGPGGLVGGTAVCVGTSGGTGAYIKAFISSPSSTYSYAIGASGTAGAAGTNGFTGGAGGSGVIIVTAYF